MAEYYENSLLTLAATTHLQLLPDVPIGLEDGVRLSYRRKDSGAEAGNIFVHRSKHINEQYQTEIRDSDLLSRAWVFQENLLSRRIIWFAPACVFLECRSRSPINEHGESLEAWRPDGSPKPSGLVLKRLFPFDVGSTAYLTLRWYDVIEAYSALRFTYPEKDRMVALSGFAKEFEAAITASNSRTRDRSWVQTAIIRHQYVAGLWTQQRHVDLLWEQAHPGRHVRLVNHPSWSWTSLYSEVLWIDRKVHKIKVMGDERVSSSSKWTTPAYANLTINSNSDLGGFPSIEMRTNLQTVVVDRLLKGWEIECLFVTHYRPWITDDLCRAVRSTGVGARLCGWASLERSRSEAAVEAPGESADHSPDDEVAGAEMLALLVSKTGLLSDECRGGYWYPYSRAYNVLFVKHLSDNKYERLGVGVLFGKDVDRGWAKHEPHDIVLV
nr:hypothetical protein B0A51_03184 [Rachicladosporium sp. CCFEE 5018]